MMESPSPFRKCSIAGCPYRATLHSTYCPKHLEEYKKKEKRSPHKLNRPMKFIQQRKDKYGDVKLE